MPLSSLCDYINQLTNHSVQCLSPVKFMDECQRQDLSSMLISKCPKCNKIFKFSTSQQLPIGDKYHYSANIGAVLGQVV